MRGERTDPNLTEMNHNWDRWVWPQRVQHEGERDLTKPINKGTVGAHFFALILGIVCQNLDDMFKRRE